MSRAWSGRWVPLADAARAAMSRAKGRPKRGAAIEDQAGTIHTGTSIVIAQVPAASLCAEHAALASLSLSGTAPAARLVLIGPPPAGASPPCGRCLQVLREIAPDVEIRWGTPSRERGRSDLGRLLPDPFDDYRRA